MVNLDLDLGLLTRESESGSGFQSSGEWNEILESEPFRSHFEVVKSFERKRRSSSGPPYGVLYKELEQAEKTWVRNFVIHFYKYLQLHGAFSTSQTGGYGTSNKHV